MKNMERDRMSLLVVLSVTAGIFMIIGAITVFLMSGWSQSMPETQFMKDAMMSNAWSFIMPQGLPGVAGITLSIISAGTGITVLISAYKIQTTPEKIRMWGWVVFISSIVGLVCASGFGIGGSIIGILAGIMTIRKGKTKHSYFS